MASEREEIDAGIQINLVAGKYASLVYLANGRSVLWSVRIRSAQPLNNVRLCISYEPQYTETQRFWISHVDADEEFNLRINCPEYDEAALLGIRDDVDGRIIVELKREDGTTIAKSEDHFKWLAYNAWAGGQEFPELLAAMVLPYDPVVDVILRHVRTKLKMPEDAAWPGYDEDEDGVREKMQALWDTLLQYSLDYKLPPVEGIRDLGVGQRVRTPSIIREKGYSTCLDSTLLIAACLTRMRINPIVILVRRHAYLCVSLRRMPLPMPLGTPLATVRNMAEQDELVAIETTCINTAKDFESACRSGISNLYALSSTDEFEALDIEQIWHELGIHPILGDCPEVNSSGSLRDDSPDSLISEQPRTRIESWQRRLLDLSLRNNLLNLGPHGTKNSIPLLVPDVAGLEDMLAEGATFRIKTLPDTFWTDTALEQSGSDSDKASLRMMEGAVAMFRKRELLAQIKPAHLQRFLSGLYSTSRREMEESGVNTLFIACGFLNWVPKGSTPENALRAPLLLVPVRLNRTSVRDGFTLSSMEEETHINQTLLELLKTEFALSIPELEGELPKDESGLDVPQIFEIMRHAITDMVGWEVLDQCSLGIFSFSKYLMWRDLTERRDTLLKNPVVKQLAADDRGIFPAQVGFPDLDTLDNEVDAYKVYTPLASDSSQLAAILAAARGKSFVLEGPPGTGKSQTIANMIAHCLGHGKTVLFVAEKAVALEVVYKRLARIGLGQFCLELHSNKTRLSAVMDQFREVIGELAEKAGRDEWEENVAAMTELRYLLNLLPWEMHHQYPDGTSLYDDICTLAEHDTLPIIPLPPGTPLEITREQKRDMLDSAHELVTHYALIENAPEQIVSLIGKHEYHPDWEEALEHTLQEIAEISAQAIDTVNHVRELLNSDAGAHLQGVYGIALELAAKWPGGNWETLLPSRAGRALRSIKAIATLAAEYQRLKKTLSLPYPDSAVYEADLDLWLRECKINQAKILPLRWWGMRKINNILRTLAASENTPNSLHDLQTLVEMRELNRRQGAEDHSAIPDFLDKGLDTQEEDLREAERIANITASFTPEEEALAEKLLEQRHRFCDDRRIQQHVEKYAEAHRCLQSLVENVAQQLRAPAAHTLPTDPARLADIAQTLLSHKKQWRNIVLWNKCATGARSAGYAGMVDSLTHRKVDSSQLEEALLVSMAKARLRAAVGAVDTLREFSPIIHEKRISDFAEQEADLRDRAGSHIRNILCRRAEGISRYEREVAVLQREASKKRAHIPLRKLLAATPNITPLLKPCFLMSPLSVAQYLSADTKAFDVVIFDEASQIPVWDAIGAIGRGQSVIICGDPHQMPPTSFFSRNRADEDTATGEPDLESILDECLACGVPKMNLTWHYRSKSEALIAFSNEQYYEGKMTTFPSPTLRDTALQLHPTAGIYEPGSSKRINRIEAQAVVEHVLQTLRKPNFRYTEATSIGVVTFNAQQQKLISDMFDDEREKDPSLEPFFAEDNPEAVFVKNLENVQGDERGVIYFSTTYGRDEEGHISMNFGPLNLAGGERRLNVAVTRARYAMHVFTSMRPDDINLNRTHARGVADLKAFLEYAGHATQVTGSGVSAQKRDALGHLIATRLQEHGWHCRTNVGASDYQVDIVVEHPDHPNTVLAGITLDGMTYSAAHTARDRDVVRPDTMRLLGWRMLNLWSIDWWQNPELCLDTLESKLRELQHTDPVQEKELPSLLVSSAPAPHAEEPVDFPIAPAAPRKAAISKGPEFEIYEQTQVLPALFEIGNRSLEALMHDIICAEAPLSDIHLFGRLQAIAPIPMARNSRAFKQCIVEMHHKMQLLLVAMQEKGSIRLHEEESLASAEPVQIISRPGLAAVLPRAAGPRPPEFIPLSELGEISRLVQVELKCIPGSDDHLRGMCDFLGLPRLTKKLKDMLLFAVRSHTPSSQAAALAETQNAAQ